LPSEAKTERNLETLFIDQSPIRHVPADPKEAVIPPVIAVHQAAVPLLDRPGAEGEQPDIQKHDGQGQTREAQEISEMGSLEVKTVPFQVAEHLFNGLITNDKFCLTRWGELQLSWWRRPLRLRE
jgi:hypothetical protein